MGNLRDKMFCELYRHLFCITANSKIHRELWHKKEGSLTIVERLYISKGEKNE